VLVAVVRSVLIEKLFLVLGQIVGGIERIRGAGRNTGTAIDAAGGIDVKLGHFLKLGLVGLGMDAVGRTNIDAEMIFNAIIGDYVCHILLILSNISLNLRFGGSERRDLDHRGVCLIGHVGM
jgi:hypothetical protein